MITVYCPVPRTSKFFPTVFLEALTTFGLAQSLNIQHVLPTTPDRGSSLLLRLPSTNQLIADSNELPGIIPFTLSAKMSREIEYAVQFGLRVVLDMGVECFFGRPEAFARVHIFIDRFLLLPKQLIIVSGNQIAARLYIDYCRCMSIEERACFVPAFAGAWRFVESVVLKGGLSKISTPTEPNQSVRRFRKFVSFNGRARPHRLLLCLFLYSRGWIDNSNVSLLIYDGHRHKIDLTSDKNTLILSKIIEGLGLQSELMPLLGRFLDRLPLELDIKSTEVSIAKNYSTRMVDDLPESRYFDEAFFNIVTETVFFGSYAFFITEKSIKALANKNPAIFIAQKGTLRFLRNWGFRTFSPMIDESYDDIEDDLDRLRACLLAITRLAEMSNEQAEKLFEKCEEVFQHNHRLFESGFVENLSNDIRDRILPIYFEPH